jgi:uncharacterized SAM-binding protein YcdF (DUF218 family)
MSTRWPAHVKRTAVTGRRGYRRAVPRRLLLVAAALVTAWLVACLVLFVWPPWQSDPPAHADAIVVLSGDKKRLRPALELVRRGVAPVLAISSVKRTRHWQQAFHLCATGRAICFDAEPFSTQGEARVVARLARERHWRSLVVVTSRFHVTRAHMLFRRCWHGSLWVVGTGSTWWRLPEEWVSETGKLLVQLTAQRGC